jgi:hypothetical protein
MPMGLSAATPADTINLQLSGACVKTSLGRIQAELGLRESIHCDLLETPAENWEVFL